MPRTPLRNLRVSDEKWARWQREAKARDLSISDLIRKAVDELLDELVRTKAAKNG